MFNLNQQLRLAGGIVCIIGGFIRNDSLALLGLMLTAIGTVNGLYAVERRLDIIEKKESPDAED